jgi:hypothetical protein
VSLAVFQEIYPDEIYIESFVKEGHNFFTLAFAVPYGSRLSFVLDVYFSDEYQPFFAALSFDESRRLFATRSGKSAAQLLDHVYLPQIEEKLSSRGQLCPRAALLRKIFPASI